MHSLGITSIVGFVLLTQIIGLALPSSVEVVILAFAVAVIGLPHGALDHAVGRKLLKSLKPASAYGVFFLSYLIVIAIVILGWFVSPMATVLCFFALSAWHFGLEEDERPKLTKLNWLGVVARGGMVIWVPAVFQGEQVASLLGMIIPGENSAIANEIVSVVRVCSPLLFVLTAIDFVSPDTSSRAVHFSIKPKQADQLRVLGFFVLFSVANPVVSFAIYFCGWHSIRGLLHLKEQTDLPVNRIAGQLLPLSAAAIVLFSIGFLFSLNQNIFSQAVLQTVFVGLSAVAIPHLLLHVVTDSVSLQSFSGGAS